MAAITGAAYTVEILQPLGVGMRGVVGLRIAKDRPGQVRNLCGVFRKSDRTQTAARVVIKNRHIAELGALVRCANLRRRRGPLGPAHHRDFVGAELHGTAIAGSHRDNRHSMPRIGQQRQRAARQDLGIVRMGVNR